MKKLFLILLVAICASYVYGQQNEQQRKKVAVYVQISDSTIKEMTKVLGDQLVSAFAKSGKYTAIERTNSFLAELGKEQDYQRTGAVDDNEISRLGRQFGVHFVCVAEVSKIGNFGNKPLQKRDKYISARLIDVESAEVVHTSNAATELFNMQELITVSKKIATELSGITGKEKALEEEKKIEEKNATKASNKSQKDELEREKKRIQDFKEKGYSPFGEKLYVQNNPSSSVTHDIAKQICKTSTMGGFTDWRLPSIGELVQIFSSSKNLSKYGFMSNDFGKSNIWSSNFSKEGKRDKKGKKTEEDWFLSLSKGKTIERKIDKPAVCHCVRDVKE